MNKLSNHNVDMFFHIVHNCSYHSSFILLKNPGGYDRGHSGGMASQSAGALNRKYKMFEYMSR
jgi:hypothetical protein